MKINHQYMRLFTVLLLALISFACQTNLSEEAKAIDYDRYPEAFQKVLEQHGGLEQWNQMSSLEFERINSAGNEKHRIDLVNRTDRIDGPDFKMGFDGEQYWVDADTSFQRDPVFYHNLMFYFYAMPFVLADEGVNYSEADPLQVDSTTTLPGVKMTFNEEVGSSPEDNYIVYYNPETYQMEWLAYTATYFSQEASDEFSYIRYDNWAEFNGLQLPQSMTWYRSAEGLPTEPRNTIHFTATKISETVLEPDYFAPPAGSSILNQF